MMQLSKGMCVCKYVWGREENHKSAKANEGESMLQQE